MLSSIITSLYADDELKFAIHSVLAMFIAFVFTSVISLKKFLFIFSRLMVCISLLAILIFFLHMVVPEILEYFPKLSHQGGFSVYNLFICVTPVSKNFYRAYGFFWEPGAFQTFINLAILITIFEKSRNQHKHLLILYVCLLLTYSTTGWIVGVINLCVLIFKKYFDSRKSIIPLLWIPLLIIGVFTFLIVSPDNIDGASFGANKLRQFIEGPSHHTATSASTRRDGFYYGFKIFVENPLIGGGFKAFSDMAQNMLHGMFTCTPINYFAKYGILYGTMISYFIFSFIKQVTKTKNKILVILACSSFLVSISSEQYVNNLIMDVFIMYGAQIASERFVGYSKETNV